MDDCRLLTVVKGLNRKVCDINGCGGQHSFLLHPDQSRASVNMFTVVDEEDRPAFEDDTEEEDDQSPRARLLRGLGIFPAEGPMQDDQPPEDDPEPDRGRSGGHPGGRGEVGARKREEDAFPR